MVDRLTVNFVRTRLASMNRGSIAHLCFGFPAAKHVGSSSHCGHPCVKSSAKKYRHDNEEDNSKAELKVPEIIFLQYFIKGNSKKQCFTLGTFLNRGGRYS